jgi:uncharacterized protein
LAFASFKYLTFFIVTMKLLAFTDIHGSTKALKDLMKKAKKADVILGCGDYTIFGNHLNYFLMELNHLDKPVIIVHGNHESEEETHKAVSLFKNIRFIHRKHTVEQGALFFGYGGGGFSMIDPQFERHAEEFRKELKNVREKDKSIQKTVVVLHGPPYNTKQDRIMNGHCGNKSYRKFIIEEKPDYVFCGHIHENSGTKDKLGKTVIINPGPKGKIVGI